MSEIKKADSTLVDFLAKKLSSATDAVAQDMRIAGIRMLAEKHVDAFGNDAISILLREDMVVAWDLIRNILETQIAALPKKEPS